MRDKMQKSTMPKAYLKKWLKALRSGEYKRGKHALYSNNENGTDPKFCCLGVLQHCLTGGVEHGKSYRNAEVPEALPSIKWLTEHNIHFRVHNSDVDSAVADVMLGNGEIKSLAVLNDSIKPQYTFKQIADYIEKNFEGI